MSYADRVKNREYNREYYKRRREELLPKARERSRKRGQEKKTQINEYLRRVRRSKRERLLAREKRCRDKLKSEVIQRLGGACACCGITELEFLSVDHVQGDGARHRATFTRGTGSLYRKVRAEGYPEGRYRVLCHNCNWSSYLGNGVCRHQRDPKPVGISYNQKSKAKLKALVFARMGGVCTCCGESEPEFLNVDHVHGGGTQHRKADKRSILVFIRDHDFPPEYQLLCWNCNRSKHFGNGLCKHQRST